MEKNDYRCPPKFYCDIADSEINIILSRINYSCINNNFDIKIAKKMYSLIVSNVYKTEKEYETKLYDEELFSKWYNNIINSNYNAIIASINDTLIGFISFGINNNEYWINEVQINKVFWGKGLLKKLIFHLVNEIKTDKIKIHINSKNIHSQNVFKHIGFKNIGNTLYEIEYKNLKKWCNEKI